MKNRYIFTMLACVSCLVSNAAEESLVSEQLVIAPAPEKSAEMQARIQNQGDRMVNIGLDQQARVSLANMLNTLLADEYALYVKTQKFHWNVVGPFFGPLHKLFNDQYDQLAGNVDKVAERVRALGFSALGTFAELAEYSSLNEDPGANPDANGMIKQLLEDHEMVIRQLRGYISNAKELGDAGTENFLQDLLTNHEKAAWMLRAHLL